jgi:hypothetical protein
MECQFFAFGSWEEILLELLKLGKLRLKAGWQTAQLRAKWNLKKSSNKLAEKFEAHCVDSWVLANDSVAGHIQPDNTQVLFLTPLQFHRRQIHAFQFSKAGKRRLYGGTKSCGFKRGSLIRHKNYGLCYVGGTMKNKISVHDLRAGKRLSQRAEPTNCQFVAYNNWRWWLSTP